MRIRFFILGISVILFGIVGFFGVSFLLKYFQGASSKTAESHLSPLEKTVSIQNARIVPVSEYELSFPFSGILESLSVQEGDVVQSSDPLLKIETVSLEIEKQKAQNAVLEAQAYYTKVTTAPRKEDLAVTTGKKKESKTSYGGTKSILVDAIRSAYTESDNAIRNVADTMFENPRTDSPILAFTLSDTSLESELLSDRTKLENMLEDWEDDANSLKTESSLEKVSEKSRSRLKDIRKFTEQLSFAVNGVTASGAGISQDTLDTWKSALATSRTTLEVTQVSLTEANTNFLSAKKALATAESEVALKEAGYEASDRDIAEYRLDEARQSVRLIEEEIRKATLIAPENDLIVQKIYPKKGEFIPGSETAILLSSKQLEMRIDIPEDDFAGIKENDRVEFSPELHPGSVILGTIVTIEPKEILKNEATYFRARAHINELPSYELRPGLTGEARISVRFQEILPLVPTSAIFFKENKRYIRLSNGEDREVHIGYGNGLETQIRSGIEVGTKVVRFPFSEK